MTPETFEPFPFFAVSGLSLNRLRFAPRFWSLAVRRSITFSTFRTRNFRRFSKSRPRFRPVIDATREAASHYASRVGALARREHLPPFEGSALQRIVEYGMRQAGDRERALASLDCIDDLAREAAFFAREEQSVTVTAAHVERALRERMLRLNFIDEEIRRLIVEGTLIVHLDGSAVGQINGLAVLDVGGYSFGRPSRLTASVARGQAGVINIEREARLSGSTHDKGIMILAGFLRGRFGRERPLAMSASIAFEQSYSGLSTVTAPVRLSSTRCFRP